MIYPAWFDLHGDETITSRPVALRLYARLLYGPKGSSHEEKSHGQALEEMASRFMVPQEIKIVGIADELRVHEDTIRLALRLLIAQGYVRDCGKGFKGMPRIQLLWEQEKECDNMYPPNQGHKAA